MKYFQILPFEECVLSNWLYGFKPLEPIDLNNVEKLFREGRYHENCSNPELKLHLIGSYEADSSFLSEEVREIVGNENFDLFLPGFWNGPCGTGVSYHEPLTAKNLIRCLRAYDIHERKRSNRLCV